MIDQENIEKAINIAESIKRQFNNPVEISWPAQSDGTYSGQVSRESCGHPPGTPLLLRRLTFLPPMRQTPPTDEH